METNHNLEKIFQLVEQFDFNELTDSDKSFVLTQMTVNDYQNLRETIKESKSFYSNKPEILPDEAILKSLSDKKRKKNIVVKTLNYPMQLYKVAASILIILGITFMIFYKSNPGLYSQLTIHDTIYIKKTDTVISMIKDTIQVVKNIIVQAKQVKEAKSVNTLFANNISKTDCSKEICPSDVDKITKLAGTNNISRDSFLTDFVVSLK
jgi:hypothetical protein